MSENKLTIIATGDISSGDHYFSLGHGVRTNFEKHGHNFLFNKIQKVLNKGDIVFGNLEGVVSDLGLDQSSFESSAFRGHPDMGKSLRTAGFDIVNIANNHILQHGEAAFNDTIDKLKKNGISPLGVKGFKEYSSLPVIKENNDIKVGFLGYSLVPEQYNSSEKCYAISSLREMINDIHLLKSSVDFVIVSCHFGVEAIDQPSSSNIDLTHSLIDAGANIILGHHSHVYQPVEKYKEGIIFYSLGNFVFDLFWDCRLMLGAIAEIKLSTPHSIEVTMTPVKINKLCQPELFSSEKTYSKFNEIVEYNFNDNFNDKETYNYLFYRKLYKLNIYSTFQKVFYFIFHFHSGHTIMKLRFLLNKVLLKISRCYHIRNNYEE